MLLVIPRLFVMLDKYISDVGRQLEGVLRRRIKVFDELELEGHICNVADGDIDGCHFLDFVVTLEVIRDRKKDRHMRNMFFNKPQLSGLSFSYMRIAMNWPSFSCDGPFARGSCGGWWHVVGGLGFAAIP